MEYQGVEIGNYAAYANYTDEILNFEDLILNEEKLDLDTELSKLKSFRKNIIVSPLNDDEKPHISNEFKEFCETLKKMRKDYRELTADRDSKIVRRDHLEKNLKNIIEQLQIGLEMNIEDYNEYTSVVNTLKTFVHKEINALGIDEITDKINKIAKYKNEAVTLMKLIHEEINLSSTVNNPCPVCYEAPVDNVFVPCGHTVCSECTPRGINNACYICRKPIKQTIKFYM